MGKVAWTAGMVSVIADGRHLFSVRARLLSLYGRLAARDGADI